MTKKSVVVVMGGIAGERDVSLSSGTGVAEALKQAGYSVRVIDVRDDVSELVRQLTSPTPDVIFNALHGPWGEDGCIQGLFEWLGIPYTHSGVLASALGIDKVMSRHLFMQAGLPCAPGHVAAWHEARQPQAFFPYPYVVKPINDGSSLGVYIVHSAEDLPPDHAFQDEQPVLIEQYIPGREIQVAVLGDSADHSVKAWGAIEIRPKQGFYDYRAKYTAGFADHFMPAPLPAQAYQQALDLAATAHQILGCRGATRVDMRYDDTQVTADNPVGKFYILELNSQPGLTSLSLVPEIMAYHGWSYPDLVSWLVENARLDLSPNQRLRVIDKSALACAK